jgi:superfamily II DNA or RNA helicase
MSQLSFKQNPRRGQAEVINRAAEPGRSRLCAKLPTGYGKTFTAACVYSTLQSQGLVDRLLYLVPTTAQLNQFVTDGHADLYSASVNGPHYVCDVAFSGAAQTFKQHRTGSHQIFACTIQGLSAAATGSTVKSLMESGRWMICVDEYHHYGMDKTWGKAVLDIERLPQCKFLLAMSATPYRPDFDSAFGEPDVEVTYRQAVAEKAVKPLMCHSYTYKIDALEEGDVVSYTTGDLVNKAGSDSQEALENVFREMRWSPKYISPLVDTPITRMMRDRLSTGLPLQVLIGAFCCSHANQVCDQVQGMFPELRVDWVGTGSNGRSDRENKRVLENFCPPKKDGKRNPANIKLDVLVHVGMAGEGLDTVYVSEIIHLNPANKNNSNDQENGRAARYLEGVFGCINVEDGTDYACEEYIGRGIEKAFDMSPAEAAEDDTEPVSIVERDWENWELPDEPSVQIYDVECININTGEVKRMDQAMIASGLYGELTDDQRAEKAIEVYMKMRRKEAEQFNERSTVEVHKDAVDKALGAVARRVAHLMTCKNSRVERSLIGDIRRRINTRKKYSLGAVDRDVAQLKRHYYWLKDLETELIEKGIPTWLK